MNYQTIIYGLTAFFCILLIHIVIWNRFKPKAEIKYLFLLFLIIPLLMLGTLFSMSLLNIFKIMPNIQLLYISMIYLALAAVYIQTYPGFTCTIPSFKILQAIDQQKERGLSAGDVEKLFEKNELVNSRIDLLKSDGLVNIENNSVKLTLPGTILANVFIIYRKLLGLEAGKG